MPVLTVDHPLRQQASPPAKRNDPTPSRHPDRHLRLASATTAIRAVDAATTRQTLAAHPALRTLPEPEQTTLLRRSRVRSLKRHEVAFRRGDPVSAVIVVLHGFLKFSTMRASGDEVVLDIIGPSDSRLELNATLGWPVGADLVALSACQLLMIDARHFRQTFENRPDGLLAILRLANQQLNDLTAHRVDHLALNACGRLAKLLMRLASLQAYCTGHQSWLPLRLSQGELGAMTGMSRELVNKYLGNWRDAGWVQMTGGNVTSIDVAALEKVSGSQADDDAESRQVATSSRR